MATMRSRVTRFLKDETIIYLQTKNKKPLYQQLREMKSLKDYYGYIPYHYIKHHMYIDSFNSSILDYIPPEIVHQYCDIVNPESARLYTEDKRKFQEKMDRNGLPTIPIIYTVFSDRTIRDQGGYQRQFPEFVSSIIESANTEFFLKPFDGGSGHGIFKMEVCDRSIVIESHKITDEEHFYNILFSTPKYTVYIIQPGFQQHAVLNRLNASCVNTIRIDTFIENVNVVHNAAFLRMSNGKFYTDNLHRGGIMVGIDLESGVLHEVGRTLSTYGVQDVREHPATGFRFSDLTIPFWEEVKKLVRSAALSLLPLHYIGWDVAIGSESPVLVEANHDLDIFAQQEAAGGLRQTPLGQAVLETRYPA